MRPRRGKTSIRMMAIAMLVAAPAAGRATAQYVYNNYGPNPGLGYGNAYGYNPYGANPGFGNYGMSLYDQEIAKQQALAESVSRYQLQTAQAEQAYEDANLIRQQAIATALENQRQAEAMTAQYNVQTKYSQAQQAAAEIKPPTIPLDQLIDAEGKVRWPDGAPVGGDLAAKRQEADAVIQAAYQQFRAKGQASVQGVVEAKDNLYAYGHPALARLRSNSALRGRVSTVLPFLQNLEAAVDSLGGTLPPAG